MSTNVGQVYIEEHGKYLGVWIYISLNSIAVAILRIEACSLPTRDLNILFNCFNLFINIDRYHKNRHKHKRNFGS